MAVLTRGGIIAGDFYSIDLPDSIASTTVIGSTNSIGKFGTLGHGTRIYQTLYYASSANAGMATAVRATLITFATTRKR